jgi:small-conductance mechanosensitive channel
LHLLRPLPSFLILLACLAGHGTAAAQDAGSGEILEKSDASLERVTLPNAPVLASHVTNFTLLTRSHGLILPIEVSVGYEVPWRDVGAMLPDAAKRTPDIAEAPEPFVHQLELGDFAPRYGVFVATRDEAAMGNITTALLANIQDVFAGKGIQIMTPSYATDPRAPKVPPPPGARPKARTKAGAP